MNCPPLPLPLRSLGRWSRWGVALWLSHQIVFAQSTPDNATTGNAPVELSSTAPGTAPITPIAAPAPSASAAAPSLPPASKPAVPREARPTWSELSRQQRHALQPLAKIWSGLSELHKRKWLVLSHNFAELSTQEQQKLQERMSDWANLTARERAQARLHYAEVQQLPGDERRAKWEAYQALSDEQRRKLADDILLMPPQGAAVASRPVAPSRLTQLPAVKPDQTLQPRIDTDQIHPKTLLPKTLTGTSDR